MSLVFGDLTDFLVRQSMIDRVYLFKCKMVCVTHIPIVFTGVCHPRYCFHWCLSPPLLFSLASVTHTYPLLFSLASVTHTYPLLFSLASVTHIPIVFNVTLFLVWVCFRMQTKHCNTLFSTGNFVCIPYRGSKTPTSTKKGGGSWVWY